MKTTKFTLAALGLLALSACAQPPAPPAYVEVPWKGQITPAAKFAPVSFAIPFRTGSVHLSKTDLKTIAEAAAAFQKGADKVTVTGTADVRGSAKANQRLSDHRADVVAKALIRAGVPAGAISANGTGETGDKANLAAARKVVIDIR